MCCPLSHRTTPSADGSTPFVTLLRGPLAVKAPTPPRVRETRAIGRTCEARSASPRLLAILGAVRAAMRALLSRRPRTRTGRLRRVARGALKRRGHVLAATEDGAAWRPEGRFRHERRLAGVADARRGELLRDPAVDACVVEVIKFVGVRGNERRGGCEEDVAAGQPRSQRRAFRSHPCRRRSARPFLRSPGRCRARRSATGRRLSCDRRRVTGALQR